MSTEVPVELKYRLMDPILKIFGKAITPFITTAAVAFATWISNNVDPNVSVDTNELVTAIVGALTFIFSLVLTFITRLLTTHAKDLQKYLNFRGADVVEDGIIGPQSVAAAKTLLGHDEKRNH